MTWLSRICFSALAALPAWSGTLSGRVELVDSRDPGVRKNKDYSGVVVWLEPVRHAAALPAPRTVTVLQKGKKFIPHITAIGVGSTVDFPNQDPIFHNAFSNFDGQPFDTGLYPPGTSKAVQFKREGVVRLFCNIHSSMSAVIVVLGTPYFAVSGPTGEFSLKGVPAGEYRLRVWHERAAEDKLKALEQKLVINDAATSLPPMRISESGYLEIPHKNKYGQDYPAVASGHGTYPGARR